MHIELPFAHSTLSLCHAPVLRGDMEKNISEGKVTEDATIRAYMAGHNFPVPEEFAWAKSFVLVAAANKLGNVGFDLGKTIFKAVIPGQYYSDGPSAPEIMAYLVRQFPGARIEAADDHVHHKLLAARSGLGRYGKNNICYVEGMGSWHSLRAFFIDREFEDDRLFDLVPLDACEGCMVCTNACPTGAVREDGFVIDAGRCLPLFNEIEGDFPAWIPACAHNVLMGCLSCQLPCPANVKALTRDLPEITALETQAILGSNPSDDLFLSLSQKLPGYYPAMHAEYLPVFSRNLKVLVDRAFLTGGLDENHS